MTTTTTTAAAAAPGRTRCPVCGAALAVRAELAGKPVKCRCGHVFVAPTVKEMADEQYRQAAEAALKRGYTPAHKRVITEDENPPPKPNIVLDIALPAVMLPAGVVLSVVQAMWFDKNQHTFLEAIGPTALGIVASMGLMIVAVLLAGMSLGIVFHTKPWQTALKIAAIALVPSAVGGIVDHVVGGFNGNILGVLTAVGLYVGLVKGVLRLPWDHTGLIVFACWTIRAFTMYAIYRCQAASQGSWL